MVYRCRRCEFEVGFRHTHCPPCSLVLNRIISRWAQGEREQTNAELASELGLTGCAFDKRVSRLGLGRKSRRYPDPRRGLRVGEIAL